MNKTKKVIIIGGGMTGLACAWFLQEKSRAAGRSLDCTVIEAGPRWGGKISTERIGDFIVEGGPDSFITQKPQALELCKTLGLADQLIRTNSAEKTIYILTRGQLIPLPTGVSLLVPDRLGPFLRSPIISMAGKLRMGLDLLIPRQGKGNGTIQIPQDESIASFVRRRLGEEALHQIAEPILAGIYAGDVEQLSIMATFPQLRALEQTHGSLIWGIWMQRWDATRQKKPPGSGEWTLFVKPRAGLSSLVEALTHKLDGVTLRTGTKVMAIQPTQDGHSVHLEGETRVADVVVATVHAHTAADWIEAWDFPLSELLRSIPYVSSASVSMGFKKSEVAHPLNGFGFVVPRSEGRKIMAATWSSTKFPGCAPPGHVLIRAFLGGVHQEGMVAQDDETLLANVRDTLRDILGIHAPPVMTHVSRWMKANPQYHVGHLARVAQIEKQAATHPGLFLAGAPYRGVGIPDCIRQGEETANKILQLP